MKPPKRWHFSFEETNSLLVATPWFVIWLGHRTFDVRNYQVRTGISVCWSADWSQYGKGFVYRRKWEHTLRTHSPEFMR